MIVLRNANHIFEEGNDFFIHTFCGIIEIVKNNTFACYQKKK